MNYFHEVGLLKLFHLYILGHKINFEMQAKEQNEVNAHLLLQHDVWKFTLLLITAI